MDRIDFTTTLANITTGLETAVATGDLGAIANLVAELDRLRKAVDVEETAVAPPPQVERAEIDFGQRERRSPHSIVINTTGLLELSGHVNDAVLACYRHCVSFSGQQMARQVMLAVVTEIMDECDGVKPTGEKQS